MKKATTTIFTLLLLFVVVFTPTVAYRNTVKKGTYLISTENYKYILSVWHIDTFEGGKGSRGDFLQSVADELLGDGVIFNVSTHTESSAKENINKGIYPDVISFGTGFFEAVDLLQSISVNKDTNLGKYGKKTYAYPWYNGGYFLIRKKGDNQPIDKVILSKGDCFSPYIALISQEIKYKTYEEKPQDEALAEFLSEKVGCALIGTQRDIVRLNNKNIECDVKFISEFSDLFGFIGITTTDKEKAKKCVEFIEYLLSDDVQKRLSSLCLFSPYVSPYGADGFFGVEIPEIKYSSSPFFSREEMKKIDEKAKKLNSFYEIKKSLKHL